MTEAADKSETESNSLPRAQARTQKFTRGAPRSPQLDPTGARLLFLRSAHGRDPLAALWSLDLASGTETLIADPATLLAGAQEELSVAEAARRERAREQSGGIVAFATDDTATVVAFALSGRLWVADSDGVRELPAISPVVDPRPDPTGAWIAYASGGDLHLVSTDGAQSRVLASAEGPDVTWGQADFIAAEEMGRHRGYWWSPDGSAVLVARVDSALVARWYIADPANPDRPAREIAYPVAGSANAEVSAHLLGLDGSKMEIGWDRDRLPYLVRAAWTQGGLVLQVMSRGQRLAQTLRVDPDTGSAEMVAETKDPIWLDAVVGVPTLLPDGRLVATAELDGARRLTIDGSPVTGAELEVEEVVSANSDGVLLRGTAEPTESHLWRWGTDGSLRRLTEPGSFHTGVAAGPALLVVTRRAAEPLAVMSVRRDGADPVLVPSYAETPPVRPQPRFLRVGRHDISVGVVLPRDHVTGTPLPVLMAPYGGPHRREALQLPERWREEQWLADRGFAVVKADGRGTGGRGPEWDRALRDEFASVCLDDQVEALHGAAEQIPDLDLSRVGIRGWSFGGYLAALAVLRRPDVFHAAVAGAPVTDWRLYDTCYTERYLGHPHEAPEVYDRNSLIADAAKLSRPLLLVHGLADDNVVAAHTLRLSAALLAAGKPHDVLPLTGVTHMTPQEVVTENLMLLQAEWLERQLLSS